MKTLKNGLLVLLFFLMTAYSKAQEPSPKPNKGNLKTEMRKQLKNEKEKLNLSAEQELKYKEINKNFGQQLREVRQMEIPKNEKVEKLKSIKLERDTAMKAMLSESQYAIFVQLQAERKDAKKNLNE
jgi:hypothetical protein